MVICIILHYSNRSYMAAMCGNLLAKCVIGWLCCLFSFRATRYSTCLSSLLRSFTSTASRRSRRTGCRRVTVWRRSDGVTERADDDDAAAARTGRQTDGGRAHPVTWTVTPTRSLSYRCTHATGDL